MRVQHPSRASAHYYDRILDWILETYHSVGVSPHADTTWVEYTVPAGVNAYIQNLYVRIERSAVATAAERFVASVYLCPGGGVAKMLAYRRGICADLYDGITIHFPQPIVLRTGDVIRLGTADYSTDGESTVSCSLSGFTFSRA